MIDEAEKPLNCSECKREPREDENPDDEWRAVSDGVGELHIFCPECWEREFGEALRLARQLLQAVIERVSRTA